MRCILAPLWAGGLGLVGVLLDMVCECIRESDVYNGCDCVPIKLLSSVVKLCCA